MSAKLKPVDRIEVRGYEIFDLVHDDNPSFSAMKADPTKFFTAVLEAHGIPVNALYIDAKVLAPTFARKDGTKIYHCKAPPASVSETIIVQTL